MVFFLAKFIFATILVVFIGSLLSVLFKIDNKSEDDDLNF
ncbi:hypothetical protein SAMN04488506_1913 [Desemzia incerta]|uniref:Uncharacterized protein n=1 Tax=Desemzia incerta TaxID=82801 RepID=A0A1I5YC89_9LACT|nr:hypothetical protein SAMN04488506_1913 [Desemzia incerta]